MGRHVSLPCDLTSSLGGKSIDCKIIIKMKKEHCLVIHMILLFIWQIYIKCLWWQQCWCVQTWAHIEGQDGVPLPSQNLFGQYSHVVERFKV